jgi:hypothetical protein
MTDRLIQISIKIPESLLERLDEFSKSRHHTRTDILLLGCEEYMDREETPEKYYPEAQLDSKIREMSIKLAREDIEYRHELREVLWQRPISSSEASPRKNSSRKTR